MAILCHAASTFRNAICDSDHDVSYTIGIADRYKLWVLMSSEYAGSIKHTADVCVTAYAVRAAFWLPAVHNWYNLLFSVRNHTSIRYKNVKQRLHKKFSLTTPVNDENWDFKTLIFKKSMLLKEASINPEIATLTFSNQQVKIAHMITVFNA